MRQTIEYKGHYIHISYDNNIESFVVQLVIKHAESEAVRFYRANTLLGAKRSITKFIKGELK